MISGRRRLLFTADVGGNATHDGKVAHMSREHDAVRYILTAPQIARRTAPYITPADFDFAGLAHEAETMSAGEALLVRIAHELWLAEHRAGLWEIVRRLDLGNFDRVLGAFQIARGARRWDELEALAA
jgi:hypothetical protein